MERQTGAMVLTVSKLSRTNTIACPLNLHQHA